MPSRAQRLIAALILSILALCIPTSSALATCGGGGGGGLGGATAGGGGAEVYQVAWKILGPGTALPDGTLIVYWFPTSPENARGSDLLTSRYLALSSAQCVTMALVTNNNAALREKYTAPADQPLAVLSSKGGAEIGRVAADGGKLRVEDVEELLRKEIAKREDAAKESLEAASKKVEEKDAEAAAGLYAKVWEQHCLLPSQGKKAAKGLKKLGKPVAEAESSSLDTTEPDLSEPRSTEVARTMRAGLAAEWQGRYAEAQRLYAEAERVDPADPVPVRFLAELLRHHIGDWAQARTLFQRVLTMRADDVSRAVALHGLGKMTIHDGEFQKGLDLFEQSLRAQPLAITYRNLAVYWNSEKQRARAYEYVKKAIDLDPDDAYNQIFAATYLAALGRPEEAAAIARRHEPMLAASYNLAAIHAQLGDKEKALEMLRRHFYVYERYDALRAKEMQEARDDIAFARYHRDADFVKLTALADTDAASSRRKGS